MLWLLNALLARKKLMSSIFSVTGKKKKKTSAFFSSAQITKEISLKSEERILFFQNGIFLTLDWPNIHNSLIFLAEKFKFDTNLRPLLFKQNKYRYRIISQIIEKKVIFSIKSVSKALKTLRTIF